LLEEDLYISSRICSQPAGYPWPHSTRESAFAFSHQYERIENPENDRNKCPAEDEIKKACAILAQVELVDP
jgi:hypothetical protein